MLFLKNSKLFKMCSQKRDKDRATLFMKMQIGLSTQTSGKLSFWEIQLLAAFFLLKLKIAKTNNGLLYY